MSTLSKLTKPIPKLTKQNTELKDAALIVADKDTWRENVPIRRSRNGPLSLLNIPKGVLLQSQTIKRSHLTNHANKGTGNITNQDSNPSMFEEPQLKK